MSQADVVKIATGVPQSQSGPYHIYIRLAENFGINAEDESKRIHTSPARLM